MNKIPVIFFVVFLTLLFVRCTQETVNSGELKLLQGLTVLKTDSTPFTGICKDFSEKGILISEKHYSEGLLDGEFTRYYKSGKIYVQVVYEMGKPIGGFKQFYENGKLKAEKTDDGKNQVLTRWFENGNKSNEVHFQNNLLHGLSEQWYKNGQKEFSCSYTNDKRTGSFITWFENGNKRYEGQYTHGEIDGKWIGWNKDNKVVSEEYYKNGKKEGTWVYYFDSGKKDTEVIYKNGLVKKNTEWDEQGHVINSFEAE